MTELETITERLEALARSEGLDYHPVDFELVPPGFMTEVAVYGLPVRMPHWSFGVRYFYQLIQHRMGHSRLFEVVFPGNPSHAYLASGNSLAENTLVAAHVLGHADFSKNNALFRRMADQVGEQIVELAAARAHEIERAISEYGQGRVEMVLDAALALEQHIDVNAGVRRARYPEYLPDEPEAASGAFMDRFRTLVGTEHPSDYSRKRRRSPVPPRPEADLLWFIAQYAPEMEGWERDIFLAVREESFYFYPIFACQIMNEGWASYWHAHLLRNADFLPQDLYLDALKTHSDVVRPYAAAKQASLALNPYHVGFCLWDRLITRDGVEQARRIMEQEDDFSFVRNYLDEDLARELELFAYRENDQGEIRVTESSLDDLRETILAPRFNFGAPRISVEEIQPDGGLVLRHHHETDGRGLDSVRAQKVLAYIRRVWRRRITLHTIDEKGGPRDVTA